MPNDRKGGAMEVQDSVIVRLVSAGRDGAGLHTAVLTDPINATVPPMTMFTATGVQLDSFEYDGTAGLLRMCKWRYGGRAPTPVDDGRGRLHVTRQQLIEWIRENDRGVNGALAECLAPGHPNHQAAIDWFHLSLIHI